MALEVGPVTPLEMLERRAEWQLAALVVALTVVPFVAAAETAKDRPEPRSVAPRTHRSGRSRNVRPPRSC